MMEDNMSYIQDREKYVVTKSILQASSSLFQKALQT